MAKFSDKTPLIKALRCNMRAVLMWYRESPLMFFCDVASAVFASLSPYVGIWLSARIIDELSGGRDPGRLTALITATLLSYVLISLISLALSRWSASLTVSMSFYRQKLYADKMLSMDFSKMDEPATHNLYAQVKQHDNWGYSIDAAVSQFTGMVGTVSGIFGVIVLTASMFASPVPESAGALTILNEPVFVLCVGAVMLGITLLSPYFTNKGGSYWNKYADESVTEQRISQFYGDVMPRERERAADIRMYRQDKICKHFALTCHVYTANSKMARYSRGPQTLYAVLSIVCSYGFIGMAYFFVCLKAWAGAFGVGAVTQYISAITSLAWCLIGLVDQVATMRRYAPFLESVFEFLDIKNTMEQGTLTPEAKDGKWEIEFKDVSFRYPGSDEWVLKNVDLRFSSGERMAVVGRNGSGKTTFIKLLCRMYDPTEGQILLNGVDIREYDYAKYLEAFSVVFQDFKLFAFTLGENVAACEDVDRERARSLLAKSGFSARLDSMPQGLDTHLYKDLSEKGVEVSGGEAQKIALARALYKKAPFVILDEPTAALDPVAEHEIYTSFNELVEDRGAIYISHRLSSCRFCDLIAVFDEGRVVQRGSHEQLVADKSGRYYELWHAQAQHYTDGE